MICLDMEGVTGSIPVAPTNKNNKLRRYTAENKNAVVNSVVNFWPLVSLFALPLDVGVSDKLVPKMLECIRK